MRRIIQKIALGAILGTFGAPVIAEDRNILWTKRTINSAQAQEAQEDLILTLYNTGRLSFRKVPMGDASTLEQVMRDNGAWVGPMTEQVATLLCKLNINRCDLAPSNSNAGKDVPSVGGIFAKPVKWTVQHTDIVTIPDVRIVQISRPEPASEDAKIEALGFSIDRVCLSENLCFDDYVTDADIPLGRWRGIVVAADESSKVGFPLKLVPHLTATVSVPEDPLPDYQSIQASSKEKHEFKDTKFQRMNERLFDDLVAPLELQLESTDVAGPFVNFGREPLATHQEVVLNSFCNIAVHGKCPEFAMDAMAPVVIGVIDKRPDIHCDFGGNISMLELDSSVGAVETAATTEVCETFVRKSTLVQRKHHGTHVLGMLAAKHNDQGVGGLLGDVPNLSYLVIPFEEDDLQTDARLNLRLADSLRRAITKQGVRLFNFSSTYRLKNDGGRDEIRELIKQWKKRVLFVAAAGKHGENAEEGICPARPACFARSMPNVIAVVGLEDELDDVQLLKHVNNDKVNFLTNYGASTFGLGAPARNIVSTVGKGGFGPMTGTSQAAPQVTAAAALLMQLTSLSPAEVRERLIYSSRLSTSAVSLVQGGALDASAALLERDWLRLENNCFLEGEVQSLKRHEDGQWHDGSFELIYFANQAVLSKSVQDIRRMHWRNGEGIFFFENGSRVERAYAGFNMNPDSHYIHLKLEQASDECVGEFTDAVVEVKLARVMDFIAVAQ